MTRKNFEVEVLNVPTAIEKWGPHWRSLADNVDGSSIFQRPGAIQAWLTHYAVGVIARVVIVHEGKTLIAVLSLMQGNVWRGPAFSPRIDYAAYDRDLAPPSRRLFPVRSLTSVLSWRASSIKLQLLCLPQHKGLASKAIAKSLSDMRGIDQIVLPTFEGEDAMHWGHAFKSCGMVPYIHRLERQVFTHENLQSVEELIASQSANFRKNCRRMFKRATQANLTITHLIGHTDVMGRLDELTEVANASWKNLDNSKHGVSMSHDAAQQAYLRDILNAEDPTVIPVLGLLQQEGNTVAATMWFQHGNSWSGLYIFRNDEGLPVSGGLLLLLEGYRKAHELGISRIDLNSTQDWVRPMSDQQQTLVNVICFQKTLRGRIYNRIANMRNLIAPM